jgi:uroporphyrinogen III methyltransferase/synthase
VTTDERNLDSKPLAGRRIAVTRPAGQAAALINGLRELGAEPLVCPTIEIVDPPDPGPLRRAAEELESYDWVVFTSANGVDHLWRELEARGQEGLPASVRVAAIGPATGEALEARSSRPEIIPEEYVAEAVADALVAFDDLSGRRVLLPRAAGARQVLPQRLRAAGAQVDEIVAYESRADAAGIARLAAALRRGEVDMVTFTASSTVRHFVEQSHGTELGRARVAVIGPITARAARSAGVRVDVEAHEYTVKGLLEAISEFYRTLRE